MNPKKHIQTFFMKINKKESGFNLYFLSLSILSAVLAVLSFQKFNIFILAWIAFIPLLYCVFKNSILYAAIYGFLTGLIFYMCSVYWMYPFLEKNTNNIYDSVIVSLISWIYMSLYFSVWAGLLSYVKRKLNNLMFALFAASLWAVLEIIKTYAFTGFPWNLLAHSQASFYPIIQIADITGAYGISFAIILVNVFIYFYLRNKNKKYILYTSAVIILLLSYGFVRTIQFDKEYGEQIEVGVIQPNIKQYKKWKGSYSNAIINTLKQNVSFFAGKNPDIILYPETVLPRMLEENAEIKKFIHESSRFAKLTLVGGMSDDGGKRYNTIFIVSKHGEILNKYKKHHLVLFGEYIPFKKLLSKLLSSLHSLNALGEIAKEQELMVFQYDDIVLGVNICSENFYPYLSRKLVLKGANILTNHTNDAWFLDMATPYQHFVMNIFRAVENRKNVIVVANTGISAIIDSSGRSSIKTKVGENISFFGKAYKNNYKTFYTRAGDFFIYICVIFVLYVLAVCVIGIIRKKR